MPNKKILRTIEVDPKRPENCLGYALWNIGVTPRRGFIEPRLLASLSPYLTPTIYSAEAQVVAVRDPDTFGVKHMVVLDERDRYLGVAVPGTGARPERVEVQRVINDFIKVEGLIGSVYLKSRF